MLRTNTCGELSKNNIGEEVMLCGWVHRRRNLGSIIFIDLRDRYGFTQIKFDPNINKEICASAEKIKNEWVIKVKGKVTERPDKNEKILTGEIEVEANSLEIFSECKLLPFEIDEEKASAAGEQLRLQYRFIDLRRPRLQEILIKRDQVLTYVREYFHKNNFIEIQTPILANSSPEGARDFLVPSRLYPGKFYALPQAPQQFKQLLMVGGFDRYFQIAPCFRDEDPRSDRHPGDFYQIDLEMSFVEQEDVWQTVEPLMIELTEKFSPKKIIEKPFPRITYREAIDKYGSDKPDLRFDMAMEDISELVTNCGFSIFTEAISDNGIVKALVVTGGLKFSRKEIDELTEIAKKKGAKGLVSLVIKEDGQAQSSAIKFLGEDLTKTIINKVGAKSGDAIFFTAGDRKTACVSLGAVRSECGMRLGLKDNTAAAWVWVTDFPMYDYSDLEEGKIDFSHNPFSMPQGGMKALVEQNPFDILAYQYDLVCNGFEISSGAIRNHEPEIMYKAFAIAGYTKEQVDKKFGHMIRAFEFGAPPHGGIAPGIDRLLMVLFDCDSIRDIYAFPKDGQARDAMLNSPSEVDQKQLEDLHLEIKKK